MKKVIILSFTIAITIALSSCQNALEEHPRDFISRSNFYENASEAESATTGIYSSIRNNYNIVYWLLLVNQADYEHGRGSQAPISDFSHILDATNIQRVSSVWSSFYQTINRANSVIDNVPNIKMDQGEKSKILAVAHFARALAYFDLVRGFGPVPLKTKESTDISAVAAPRAPIDSVYQIIVKDGKIAAKNLPESVGDATGRASKWAAKMLLAEAYLTHERWNKAAKEADDVIKSGEYSLVKVKKSDDFNKIFAGATDPEDIFSIHNSIQMQSQLAGYISRANTPPYNYSSGGVFAWLPNMKSFIFNDWNNHDLRNHFNLHHTYLGPNGKPVPLPASTPWLFGKFRTNKQGYAVFSNPIFRYTEAFLIYAEAADMANKGPTPLALERLNMIKRRGYGYNPSEPSPVDYSSGMGQKAFRDSVLRERAFSFMIEGKRWWDLKRTHRVKKAMAAVGRTVIDARLLWPIPLDEIENNPDISQQDQNPGY
jgi:hypothetical protein